MLKNNNVAHGDVLKFMTYDQASILWCVNGTIIAKISQISSVHKVFPKFISYLKTIKTFFNT